MMSRLIPAMLVAAVALGAAPASANEFCDKELTPIVQQRKALQDKLASISKRAKQEGSREQFCGTLNAYIGNIRKFVTYIEANKDFCGVPDEAITEAKKGLVQNQSLRRKVCVAAAQPQARQTPGKPAIPKPPVELRLQ
jgi:hypothetical protein